MSCVCNRNGMSGRLAGCTNSACVGSRLPLGVSTGPTCSAALVRRLAGHASEREQLCAIPCIAFYYGHYSKLLLFWKTDGGMDTEPRLAATDCIFSELLGTDRPGSLQLAEPSSSFCRPHASILRVTSRRHNTGHTAYAFAHETRTGFPLR